MKPGNLRLQGAKSCGKPRYEGKRDAPISWGAFFVCAGAFNEWRKNHERIPVYIGISNGGAS